MITEPTLFILGAGASYPYGYPLASGLRNIIIEQTEHYYRNYYSESYSNQNSKGKLLRNRIKMFCDSFKSLGSDELIDYFLSTRSEFEGIGKTAMFFALAEAEKETAESDSLPEDDWARYLLFKMVKDVPSSDLDLFYKNTVKFITFNYDRSLEYILYHGIQAKYAIQEQDVHDLLKDIEIHHVYGRLPFLPIESSNIPPNSYPCEYGRITDLHISDIDKVNTIKTMRERNGINTDNIQKMIKWAKRIYFLGFGFAKENVELLNIRINPDIDKDTLIGGTRLNTHSKTINAVENFILTGNYTEKDITRPVTTQISFSNTQSRKFLEDQFLE